MQKIVIGNWKMNLTAQTAQDLARAITPHARVDVVACPIFLHVSAVADVLPKTIGIGVQNCAEKPTGALTGEIAASQIADMGCKYVIIGHSERRQFLQESDAALTAKLEMAIAAGLTPIFCIGETLAQRQAGETHAVLESQINGVAKALGTCGNIIVAYEPVWAIGTGMVANPADIKDAHDIISQFMLSRLAKGAQFRVIYGGSVKPDNAAAIFALPKVDGALVGGASLKAQDFNAIVAAAA